MWREGIRGIFDPVFVLQHGLNVRISDDNIIQLQLWRFTLSLHRSDQIHCGSEIQRKHSSIISMAKIEMLECKMVILFNLQWVGMRSWLIHSKHILGVKLQEVRRMAVTMTAHNHQRHNWCQEDGGEYTYGHDHHRLHCYRWRATRRIVRKLFGWSLQKLDDSEEIKMRLPFYINNLYNWSNSYIYLSY